jgi:hypothetical protein
LAASTGDAAPVQGSRVVSESMKLWRWRRDKSVRVTLYSKTDCGLCREAEAVARRVFGVDQVDVVDIIGDRQLEDEFVFRIPVMVVDGRVVAEGRITMADARGAQRAARREARTGARR